eukprot:s1417_g7.t1
MFSASFFDSGKRSARALKLKVRFSPDARNSDLNQLQWLCAAERQEWGPHVDEGKAAPSVGDEPLAPLPTVLEDIEINPDPFPFINDSFHKLNSLVSKDSGSNVFSSSEAASPWQISPMSSGLMETGGLAQVNDRTSNNTTNLAKVLAAGRKSQRQISPPEETTLELNGKLATIMGRTLLVGLHYGLYGPSDSRMAPGYLNAFMMAMELECIGNESAAAVDVHVAWECANSSVFPILEHVFTWIFASECKYFQNLFNLGDTFLVILPMIDLYILAPLANWSANVEIFRLLRLAKLARAVRLMRTLRLFRGLRLLVQACSSFLPSLAWSMALLGICMMMGSLVMGNLLQEYIRDPEKEMEARVWVYEITMAGNWPTRAREDLNHGPPYGLRLVLAVAIDLKSENDESGTETGPILESVDHKFAIFYVIYVTFIVFAVIRIITAVFLRETLEAANNDAEMMVQERLLQNARYVKKLEGIFAAMDESGDGLLTEDEMILSKNIFTLGDRRSVMNANRGQALFQLLQNGEGMVTYEDFIDGVLRCKGPARAIDQTFASRMMNFSTRYFSRLLLCQFAAECCGYCVFIHDPIINILLPRICLQCDVKNVADSLKSLVSSLEENKVIRGKRRQGKRRRVVHKEDLLLLAASRPNKGMSRQTRQFEANSWQQSERAQPPEPVAQDEEAPAFEPGPSEPEPETTVPEVAEGTRTSTPREVERSNDLVSEVASSSDSSLSDVDSLDEDVSDCCGTEGPPLDPEAVVRAIPVESCSRQAEHALDGAEMCLKVARLAEEAACGTRTWQQLLRCGTHLLDSTHCVTRAASGVARCAVNVPSDLVPLLEKIKTAQGMTRPAVNATRELMRCTEIISERGLKAAELSNRLLQQSQALADTLQSAAEDLEIRRSRSAILPEGPPGETQRKRLEVFKIWPLDTFGSTRASTVGSTSPSSSGILLSTLLLNPTCERQAPADIEHSRSAMWFLREDDPRLEPCERSRTALVCLKSSAEGAIDGEACNADH